MFMGDLVSFYDVVEYINTNRKPANHSAVEVFPLVPRSRERYCAVLLENSKEYIGALLGKSYFFVPGLRRSSVSEASYFRLSKRFFRSSFEFQVGDVQFERRVLERGLSYAVAVFDDQVLPFPSIRPYALCQISHDDYLDYQEYLPSRSLSDRNKGLNMIVNLFGERVSGFCFRYPFARKTRLVTPVGYADSSWIYSSLEGKMEFE